MRLPKMILFKFTAEIITMASDVIVLSNENSGSIWNPAKLKAFWQRAFNAWVKSYENRVDPEGNVYYEL